MSLGRIMMKLAGHSEIFRKAAPLLLSPCLPPSLPASAARLPLSVSPLPGPGRVPPHHQGTRLRCRHGALSPRGQQAQGRSFLAFLDCPQPSTAERAPPLALPNTARSVLGFSASPAPLLTPPTPSIPPPPFPPRYLTYQVLGFSASPAGGASVSRVSCPVCESAPVRASIRGVRALILGRCVPGE